MNTKDTAVDRIKEHVDAMARELSLEKLESMLKEHMDAVHRACRGQQGIDINENIHQARRIQAAIDAKMLRSTVERYGITDPGPVIEKIKRDTERGDRVAAKHLTEIRSRKEQAERKRKADKILNKGGK